MKKQTVLTVMGAMFLIGCNSESPIESSGDKPSVITTREAGQRTLSEIPVGQATVTFYANGEAFAILEKNLPGAEPVLGRESGPGQGGGLERYLVPG